jgi:hypothetical protein
MSVRKTKESKLQQNEIVYRVINVRVAAIDYSFFDLRPSKIVDILINRTLSTSFDEASIDLTKFSFS